jgi:hypothetical protein
MDHTTAPQRIVANPEYPYDCKVERARAHLARMGIADVKPLYGAPVRVVDETPAPDERSHLNRLIRTTLFDRMGG